MYEGLTLQNSVATVNQSCVLKLGIKFNKSVCMCFFKQMLLITLPIFLAFSGFFVLKLGLLKNACLQGKFSFQTSY